MAQKEQDPPHLFLLGHTASNRAHPCSQRTYRETRSRGSAVSTAETVVPKSLSSCYFLKEFLIILNDTESLFLLNYLKTFSIESTF